MKKVNFRNLGNWCCPDPSVKMGSRGPLDPSHEKVATPLGDLPG